MIKNSLRIKGIMLVTLGALFWGVSGTVAQYLFQTKNFTPEWLVVIRMLCSGIILLVIGAVKKDQNIVNIWKCKENITKLLVFSLLGMLGVQYTYFAAISHGNAATATILQYLSPIIIISYLSIRNKKLPKMGQLICILMALIGTFLILTKGNLNTLSISNLAIFWGVASACACAIYTLQPVALLKKYGSIPIVGWGMFIGGIVFSFIYSPFDCTGTFTPTSILAILFVIIFGTIIAFSCYLESLKYIDFHAAKWHHHERK